MNIIQTASATRFTLNGVQYLKNYLSAVYGNKLEIFNCYERQDVLVSQAPCNQFSVDGVVYNDPAALQSALMGVIYYRDSLDDGGTLTDQDNIDIKKTFKMYGNATPEQILAKINALPSYGISEKQSVWFIGYEPVVSEWVISLATPRIVKYKMMNKGKGMYGAGGIALTLDDIELVYNQQATITDIDIVPTTDIINYGALNDQTVSAWLNMQNPAYQVQSQEDGYTLFKGSINDTETTWLWVGQPGLYGENELQSTLAGFQKLSEALPAPVDQDNIDIRKPFGYNLSDTPAQILAKINSIPAYTVSEKQSVWFVGSTSVLDDATARAATTVKYKMMNKGKGTYGAGGIQLVPSDIELIYLKPVTVEDVEADPSNTIQPLGEVPDGNYIAAANATEWDFTNTGVTFYFSYITDGVLYMAQFVGEPGLYGGPEVGANDFLETDFVSSVTSNDVPVPGVQSVSGYGVDNTNALNPIIHEVKDLPKDFFISTTSNDTYLTYLTDTYRQFDLQPFVAETIISTNEITRDADNPNNLAVTASYTGDSSLAIIIVLENCHVVNNVLVVEKITYNILPIGRIYSAIFHRNFIYLSNLPNDVNVLTTILKINPYNLADIKSFQFPNQNEFLGNTSSIIGYKEKLFVLFARGGSNLAYFVQIDENLNTYEILFSAGSVSTKRVRKDSPFVIYNDEVYIPTYNNSSPPAAYNTIGMSVYSIQGILKREAALLPISTGYASGQPNPYWMSIFGGKIIITCLQSGNPHRELIRIDTQSLALEEVLNLDATITDDNTICSNGYIYLNGIYNPVIDILPQLLKVKYNDFTDFNIEISNYNNGLGSLGSLNPIVVQESLKTKLSDFKNDLISLGSASQYLKGNLSLGTFGTDVGAAQFTVSSSTETGAMTNTASLALNLTRLQNRILALEQALL